MNWSGIAHYAGDMLKGFFDTVKIRTPDGKILYADRVVEEGDEHILIATEEEEE